MNAAMILSQKRFEGIPDAISSIKYDGPYKGCTAIIFELRIV